MYKIGRFLQFVGLFVVLPAAIAGQIVPGESGQPILTVGQMLVLAAFGMIIFYVGRNLLPSKP